MKDENDPVSDSEQVFRLILRDPDYIDLSLPLPVHYAAFAPNKNDADGISVYRQDCGITAQEASVAGTNPKGYHVARLNVADILAIDIDGLRPTVVATPQPEGPRGHASIHELNIKLRNGDKPRYRQLAQELAILAGKDLVYLRYD